MAAMARTPVFPEATLVGALSAQTVRKVAEKMRTIAQTKIFRDFSASDRSQASKTGQDLHCVKTP
jgi:hypothetical protein